LENTDDDGILGSMFDDDDANSNPPKKPRLHYKVYRTLSDLPALKLGNLGQPLLTTPRLASIHKLRTPFGRAVPSTAPPPEQARVARPFQQMPVNVVFAEPFQPMPVDAVDAAPVQQEADFAATESPRCSTPTPDGDREATPDPFANFRTPSPDYEEWVMYVSPSKKRAFAEPAAQA